MKKLLLTLTCLAALTSNAKTTHAVPDSLYIKAYGSSNSKEGIRIDYSADQKTWVNIGNNRSFVRSDYGSWGSQKNMFNPSVIYDGGKFYAVWQISDRDPQFASTTTTDLWLWKPQDYPYVNGITKTGEIKSVIEPVLTKEGDKFVITFKNNDGRYYNVKSSDFVHWSTPAAVSGTASNKKESLMKVPSSIVTNLITQSQAASLRGQQEGESMRGDAQRFANISDITSALRVDLNSRKSISPELFGIFFEDINYSADGGLYAELIQNRDFEYSSKDRGEWNAKTAWTLEGEGTEWSIVNDWPIHVNNSHYSILNTKTPGAKLINSGFDGIPVAKGEKYNLSLFLCGHGKVKVSIIGTDNAVLASTTISVPSQWKKMDAVLSPYTSDSNSKLAIEPLQSGSVMVDLVSLFPQKTYKGRRNGMRADLAQTLADMHPQFVRFPGGCATHGQGIDNIYHWQATIGDLWERQHDFNIWGYHQTRGIGFYEYFQFCEDIGAQPLPVLAAGVPCQNSYKGGNGQQGGLPWESELKELSAKRGLPIDSVSPYFYNGKPLTMESYLQELLDLIEWANGDPKTSSLAKMRAAAGHPKPFNLKYLGIGNEDLISDVFLERYNYLVSKIKAAHPEITIVGTVGPFWEGSDYEFGWADARQTGKDIVDEHYYNPVGWYLNNQDFYDKYDRNGTKVYLGEWASKGNNLENALAEAIHVTNFERNGDVVVMSSYAPLLAKEGHTQWNPDLIYFNNTEVKPTVNYWVQALSGQNAGDEYVYSSLQTSFKRNNRTESSADVNKRISSSVVVDKETGDIIIKLVNALPHPSDITISLGELSGYQKTANVTFITGNPNEKGQKPETTILAVSSDMQYTMPKYSFNVIRIKKGKK